MASLESPAQIAAQGSEPRHPTARVYGSREGLVGSTTANGHVIADATASSHSPRATRSARATAPSSRSSSPIRAGSRRGPGMGPRPWNIADDYWSATRRGAPDLPRFLPQAEAAVVQGHNGGRSLTGRAVTAPNAIDIADGTFWDDLGMTVSDRVDVTFLWLNE